MKITIVEGYDNFSYERYIKDAFRTKEEANDTISKLVQKIFPQWFYIASTKMGKSKL